MGYNNVQKDKRTIVINIVEEEKVVYENKESTFIKGCVLICKWVFLFYKWILSILWGGPYLLYKGIKSNDRVKIIIGVEYSLFSLLFIITASAIKEGSGLYWINYVLCCILLINVVPLVSCYKENKANKGDN